MLNSDYDQMSVKHTGGVNMQWGFGYKFRTALCYDSICFYQILGSGVDNLSQKLLTRGLVKKGD